MVEPFFITCSENMFDRGYPNFFFFETLNLNDTGFYVVCYSAASPYPAVETFVQRGEK